MLLRVNDPSLATPRHMEFSNLFCLIYYDNASFRSMCNLKKDNNLFYKTVTKQKIQKFHSCCCTLFSKIIFLLKMNHLELLCTLIKQLLIHFHEELQCIVDESMDGLIPVVFAEIESKFCNFSVATYIRRARTKIERSAASSKGKQN
jgi:hypothetical protein